MAARKRGGLGSGLANLIPSNQRESKDSPVDVFFADTAVASTVSRETATSIDREAVKKANAHKQKSKAGKSNPKASETSENKERKPKKPKGEPAAESKKAQVKSTSVPVAEAKKTEEGAFSASRTAASDSATPDLVAVPGVTYGELPVVQIVPNTRQPRTVFDEDELQELADSIAEVGVLQPVIVRPLSEQLKDNPEARYELIMGERRWRASQLAGNDTVPAIVRRTADEDLLRDALLENLHRAQLNPLEEAAAYQQLLEDFACTQEELSRRIARSRPQISNTLRLLKLPPLVQQRVAAQIISAGHARALLSLPDPVAMEKVAQRIVAENLSVRKVEEIVAMWDEPAEERKPVRTRRVANPELEAIGTQLGDRFETKVKVTMGTRKGTIRIDFAGRDDLDRILQVLAPELAETTGYGNSPRQDEDSFPEDKPYDLGY